MSVSRVARVRRTKSLSRGGDPDLLPPGGGLRLPLGPVPDRARTDAGAGGGHAHRPARHEPDAHADLRPGRAPGDAVAEPDSGAEPRGDAPAAALDQRLRGPAPARPLPGQRQGAPQGGRHLGDRLDAPRRPGRRLLREDRLHRRALDLRGAPRGEPGAPGLRGVRHGPGRGHGPARADVVPRRAASAGAGAPAARTTPRTSTRCWPTAGGPTGPAGGTASAARSPSTSSPGRAGRLATA